MIVLKPPGADSIVDPSQVKAALKVGLKMVQHVGLANHIVFSKAVVDLFSDDVPAGQVVSQTPAAGESLDRGGGV